jgi:kumamolisin
MSSDHGTDPDALKSEELEVRAAELQARRLEAQRALAATTSPWWRRADPLAIAIFAGALTLLGNIAVSVVNNYNSVNQERLKASDDLALEQKKSRYNLVLQAMTTNNAEIANRNIRFFIDAGLLADDDCKIRDAIDLDQPVLPSLSGTAPPTPAGMHSVPEIMTLYNFPPGFDGRGQTIGFLEFGGSVASGDLAQYFKSLNLPSPDISTVSIDGASYKPGTDADNEVMINVEIAGSIAPRAHIRVYYAPNSAAGYADAVKQAEADHVSVLATGWGEPEVAWKDEDLKTMDAAFEAAARQNITVMAAGGDLGVTDGVKDGRPHVDFPASSPWVLSVGGTTLKSEGNHIISETVYKDASGQFASGGGVSEKFARPDWQSGVAIPKRYDGNLGRGIPDVVASADPRQGIPITVHGRMVQIGGTSGAMPLLAGLIALINQALGYNVGYLNPRLYQEMGPAGVFRAVTSGDNGVPGVKGYAAGPGWTPVAGWGSPDGMKLLTWLRANPGPNRPNTTTHAVCRPSSS